MIFDTTVRQSEFRGVYRASWLSHGRAPEDAVPDYVRIRTGEKSTGKGDRGGFVALDVQGKEVFAVARWVGVKTRQVAKNLGLPDQLPEIDAVRADNRAKLITELRGRLHDNRARREAVLEPEQRGERRRVKPGQ